MTFSFRWLGHSAFDMQTDGHSIVFDPYLSQNPVAAAQPEALNPELILISHGHNDHLGDTVAIATRTGATVICNFEIGEWLSKRGVKVFQGNVGGGYDHGIAHVRFTLAHHSSSLPDGTYGGDASGFILTLPDGTRAYYAGDTSLFLEMQLIGDAGIDVAFLPIGDNYTMGPDDSLKAIGLLRPKLVVPMHYNTWDNIAQDANQWASRVKTETEAQPVVLNPGESYTLS